MTKWRYHLTPDRMVSCKYDARATSLGLWGDNDKKKIFRRSCSVDRRSECFCSKLVFMRSYLENIVC